MNHPSIPPRFRALLLLLSLGLGSPGGASAAAVPFKAGDILSTNFGMQNRFLWTNDNGQVFTPSNTTLRLHDFEGKIVFYTFFDVWCGKCQSGLAQTSAGIRHWYESRFNGTSNGIPVAFVVANMEPLAQWQAQADVFLRSTNVVRVGNDYVGSINHGIRNLFAPPNATNSDPRPLFLAINGLSNSPSHRQWEVLIADFSNGGGAFDFTPALARWKAILDSVQAPRPVLAARRSPSGPLTLSFPAQRGRTNTLERTTDLVEWVAVTNASGTNAMVSFVETTVPAPDRRFYRVRRQ